MKIIFLFFENHHESPFWCRRQLDNFTILKRYFQHLRLSFAMLSKSGSRFARLSYGSICTICSLCQTEKILFLTEFLANDGFFRGLCGITATCAYILGVARLLLGSRRSMVLETVCTILEH